MVQGGWGSYGRAVYCRVNFMGNIGLWRCDFELVGGEEIFAGATEIRRIV